MNIPLAPIPRGDHGRSEGRCPNGIFDSWVRWGWGLDLAGEFFRRRRRRRCRRRPPQKELFGKIQILLILTHSRAMNFLASPYGSYGRGGSFLCS